MKTITQPNRHMSHAQHVGCCGERIKQMVGKVAADCGMTHLPGRDVVCESGNFCLMVCFLAPSSCAPACRIVLVRVPLDNVQPCCCYVSDCKELVRVFTS